MLLCPTCDIAFSPSNTVCPVCPVCNVFPTPQEERTRFLLKQAIEQIESGDDCERVRLELIANGLTDADADVVVQVARQHARAQTRKSGFRRLMFGGVILLGGVALLMLVLIAAMDDVAGKAILLGGVLGLVTIISGGLACVSAAYEIITGQESRIPLPDTSWFFRD